jgi:beta-galactosidase
VLGAAGLKVVLGTPTATPPKWLVDTMPDMLAVGADGKTRGFGSRRHYCFSHQGYRSACARIVTSRPSATAGIRRSSPGRPTTNMAATTPSRAIPGRPARLSGLAAQKYQSPDALNRAWGNVFWSMEYRSFDEVELPNLTVTEPTRRMSWISSAIPSDQVVAFNRLQTDIIRAHSPDVPIAHNFMGKVAFDHLPSARISISPHGTPTRSGSSTAITDDEENKRRYLGVGDPDNQAFHHDLYRACGQIRNGGAEGDGG